MTCYLLMACHLSYSATKSYWMLFTIFMMTSHMALLPLLSLFYILLFFFFALKTRNWAKFAKNVWTENKKICACIINSTIFYPKYAMPHLSSSLKNCLVVSWSSQGSVILRYQIIIIIIINNSRTLGFIHLYSIWERWLSHLVIKLLKDCSKT